MLGKFDKMILIYMEDKYPKEYMQMRKEGRLKEFVLEWAKSMNEQVLRLTDQLTEKNGGQAQSIAEEIVIANNLPS